jgi:hypothetical protein
MEASSRFNPQLAMDRRIKSNAFSLQAITGHAAKGRASAMLLAVSTSAPCCKSSSEASGMWGSKHPDPSMQL